MTEDYYNNLALYYKLIYPNWDASVQRQADALDSVIQEFVGKTANTILDVACGIGTQDDRWGDHPNFRKAHLR